MAAAAVSGAALAGLCGTQQPCLERSQSKAGGCKSARSSSFTGSRLAFSAGARRGECGVSQRRAGVQAGLRSFEDFADREGLLSSASKSLWIPQPPAGDEASTSAPRMSTYTGPAWCPLPSEMNAGNVRMSGVSPASVDYGGGYNEHRAKTPPPDLPSLLLDSRIIFLGMPLVPAVTELMVAQLIYLQYTDGRKPMYMYINSTGTARADGETVGFETEGSCVYDAMRQVTNDVFTVNIGVAAGQAALLLAAGKRGKRFCLPHATTMLQMPSMPGSGQQSASEMVIKSNEAMDQYTILLELLSLHTRNNMEQINKWMQNPFYMTPTMAIKHGFVDQILNTQAISKAKSANEWDKEAGLRQVQRPAFGAGAGGLG